MDIKDALTQFISSELLEDEDLIGADENLLADGVIDSLSMLRLIGFIEASFNIKVPPEHFTIEHFRTIAVLSHYVESVLRESEQTLQ